MSPRKPIHKDDDRMRRLTASLPTKSAKIRSLAAGGYTRQQIADFLNIRYQHVRNVLVQAPSYREEPPSGDEPGSRVAESEPVILAWTEAGSGDSVPSSGSFVVDGQGRITLPPDVAAALDARPGRVIPWRFEEGELKLMSIDAGLRFAQQVLGLHLAPSLSVDDFLAERRAEAEREGP